MKGIYRLYISLKSLLNIGTAKSGLILIKNVLTSLN